MWKILRHGVSVVCLLLALLASGLWVRSHTVSEGLIYLWASQGPELHAISCAGYVIIGAEYDVSVGAPAGWRFHQLSIPASDSLTYAYYVDLLYASIAMNDGLYFAGVGVGFFAEGFAIIVPFWMLLSLLLIFPLVDFVLWMRGRRQRKRSNSCPQCHYDLRASTTACPECGTPIAHPIGKLPA